MRNDLSSIDQQGGEDRQRIIELRGQLGSRSAVFQEFWKTDRKPGGAHYQVIRVVLDQAGLP